MATRRQIRANRSNAKLCTGPKTEAGKEISSQNAVRHGLLSRAVVLKAESSARFDELLASLIAEFKPLSLSENELIETMAIARWRQIRNATLFTATFEIEMARQNPNAGNAPIRAALALRGVVDSSHVLTALARYQTADSRLYSRAFQDFLIAKAARSADGPLAFVPPISLALEGTWEKEEIKEDELRNETNLIEKALDKNDSKADNR